MIGHFRRTNLTDDDWLKHFEEAYKIPFHEDIRLNVWKKRTFSSAERDFLLTDYSVEFKNSHLKEMEVITEIFMRYLFKKVLQGYVFCDLDKPESLLGNSLSKIYGVSSGHFYNLAKVYWTFKYQLDEDSLKYTDTAPFYISILRTVEAYIGGEFFTIARPINIYNQKRVLQEFAPEIDVKEFMDKRPPMAKKAGCLGILLIIPILLFSVFLVIKWIS